MKFLGVLLNLFICVGLPTLLTFYSQVFFAVVIPLILLFIWVIVYSIIYGYKSEVWDLFIFYIYYGIPSILGAKCIMWFPEHIILSVLASPFLLWVLASLLYIIWQFE